MLKSFSQSSISVSETNSPSPPPPPFVKGYNRAFFKETVEWWAKFVMRAQMKVGHCLEQLGML